MKTTHDHVVIAIGIFCLLTGCGHPLDAETKRANSGLPSHNVSMDRLWRVSPETARKFPHGTLEFVIYITGDASDTRQPGDIFFGMTAFLITGNLIV